MVPVVAPVLQRMLLVTLLVNTTEPPAQNESLPVMVGTSGAATTTTSMLALYSGQGPFAPTVYV